MYNTDPELCDRCCATSKVRVWHPRTGGELQFCTHHLAECGDALLEQGWVMAPDEPAADPTPTTDADAFADVVSMFDRSGFTGPPAITEE